VKLSANTKLLNSNVAKASWNIATDVKTELCPRNIVQEEQGKGCEMLG